MAVKLIVEPETSPVKWEEFLNKYPKYSIAIDGFVCDETKYCKEKVIANFNHHEKVNRLSTNATCYQILLYQRMNFSGLFRNETNEIEINVYANDCDEDVCLSYFLLKYGYMSEYVNNPVLNRLVSMENVMDTTSGTYPIHKDAPILRELAWIFEPYYRAKFNNILNLKKAEIFKGIIEDVEHRILAHIMGRGQQVPLDTRYKVLGGGASWKMIEEIGIHSKAGMVSDGISSFITVKSRDTDKWNYVIGKTSPFVNTFNLEKIFKRLNSIEGSDSDQWGGSDIIGGSPRVNGSKISPSEMEEIINDSLYD